MIRLAVALLVVVNVVVALFSQETESVTAPANTLGPFPSEQGDQLILLSEVDTSGLISTAGQSMSGKEEALPEPGASISVDEIQICVLTGPFADESRARGLADRVGALGIRAELITETSQTPGSIMVYIGPFASAQQAQRELGVLQSSGVDSFVVADGELINAISLGVFRTEANAQAQQDRIGRLGYETNTYQFMVENDQYLVNFRGEVLNALPDDYWVNIANEYKDISIEQKACDEVASSGNFL